MAKQGNVKSRKHTMTNRAHMRSTYHKYKAMGICPNCRCRPPRPERTYCEVCSTRNRNIQIKRRSRLLKNCRALKICTTCLCREAMPNRKWCGVCSERHTDIMREKAHRRIAKNACRRCGKALDRDLDTDPGTQCLACLKKARAEAVKYRARKKQKQQQTKEKAA